MGEGNRRACGARQGSPAGKKKSEKKERPMEKSQYGRRDRLIQEKRHDAYQERGKWPEPTVCSECSAVYLEGRWTWFEPAVNANPIVCPACQRIKDKYPAGYLELRGGFFHAHRKEIENMIRNIEEQQKAERPMERIMEIAALEDHVLVTTTGIHLARRLGEALSSAYQGDFSFTYGDGEKSIRAAWVRD
jgi:NMD protein affecting ribosome stability and mRNA decay